MTATNEVALQYVYLADVMRELGGVPAERVRLHPAPGKATVNDLTSISKIVGLYEMIDSTLVRKPVGANESSLALILSGFISTYLMTHRIGITYGESTLIQFAPDLILSPDLSFIHWDRIPNRVRPQDAIVSLVPNLVIELLSRSNTAAEMHRKRVIYFKGGVERVWEVDIEVRTLTAYHSADEHVTYTRADIVPGEPMLPGLRLSLQLLFELFES